MIKIFLEPVALLMFLSFGTMYTKSCLFDQPGKNKNFKIKKEGFPMSGVRQVSCVTCKVSRFRCGMSDVMFHMSLVTCH